MRTSGEMPQQEAILPDTNETLGDQLEYIRQQIVDILPEKLYEANLHQIIEALKFVLEKIGQTGDDQSTDARERLIQLLDRYAEAGEAQRSTQRDDGG
jgi:hypothetical protein